MASPISISLLVVQWTTFVLYFSTISSSIPAHFAVAAFKSSIELEAEALLNSGWWDNHTMNASNHCKWPGVICDKAGTVSEISMLHYRFRLGGKLDKFNFSSFPNLVHLDLSGNGFHGSIPYQIGVVSKLKFLNLSGNDLTGEIPSILGSVHISYLNLSHNKLSGIIPHSLVNMSSIDLSYNGFKGPIAEDFLNKSYYPRAFIGNQDLCDGKYFPSCTKRNEFLLYIPIFPPIIVFCGYCISRLFSRHKAKKEARVTKHGNVFSIWNYNGTIAYEDIIEATEDFDIKYCIGTGGYGSVYRAQLACGKVVALKKLHHLEGEVPAYDKSFRNEARILSEIKHRNIVKLYGYCLHKACMFLIYEFLERGSLFCILRDETEAVEVDWMKRVNIVKGIAHALAYMHHDCTPPILHRDLSSNNILLNSNLESRVSDFGTARLLDPDSSNQTIMIGTYGYIAPGDRSLPVFPLSFIYPTIMDSGSPSNSLEPSHVEQGPIEAIEIDGNSNSICSTSPVLNLSPQRENIHDTDENLTDKKFTLKWTKLTIIMAYSTVLALLSTTFVKYGGKLLPEIFIQHPTSYWMFLILLMVVFFFSVNGVIFSEQSPPIGRACNLVALVGVILLFTVLLWVLLPPIFCWTAWPFFAFTSAALVYQCGLCRQNGSQ